MHNPIQILFTGQSIEKGIIEKLPSHLIFDIIPFIETNLSVDEESIDALQQLVNQNAFVVVTSQIAVNWLRENMTIIPNWSIACMKGQTEKALVDLGWGKLIQFTAKNSLELAKAIASNVPKSNIITFVGSNQRLANLPNYLENQDFSVKELVAYTTIAKYQEIDKQYDAIIFLSPSAVNSFFDHYSIGAQVKLFAIGQTTSEAIYKRTNNESIVSDGTSQSELFNTIINYYQNICH